jgi:hypothetical protein
MWNDEANGHRRRNSGRKTKIALNELVSLVLAITFSRLSIAPAIKRNELTGYSTSTIKAYRLSLRSIDNLIKKFLSFWLLGIQKRGILLPKTTKQKTENKIKEKQNKKVSKINWQ